MNPLETDQNSDLDLDCQKLIPSEATITPLDVAPSPSSRSVDRPRKQSSSIDRQKETLTFEMGKANLSELDQNFHYRKLNLESKGLKILGEQLTRFNLISELGMLFQTQVQIVKASGPSWFLLICVGGLFFLISREVHLVGLYLEI